MRPARSPLHAAFGIAMRERRTALKLSQDKLAEMAELDATYLSGIEHGYRNPGLLNVLTLADCLEIPASQLVRRAEEILREGGVSPP